MQIGRYKCPKVTFRKGLLVKSKNTTLDISMEITELEHNKTYKYLGINEANDINHTINKEKIRKEFYRWIKATSRTVLNVKNK